FALREHGYLFLGKSEMLVRHTDLFASVELGWRVFQRIPGAGLRERVAVLGEIAVRGAEAGQHLELREAAAASTPVARLIVDPQRFLIEANEAARGLFSVGPADLGRPLQDLDVSYQPLDIRSPLDEAFESNRRVHAGRVDFGDPGKERVLEVEIDPILGQAGGLLGAAITFTDVTDYVRLASEHTESKRQLETAYEELQSTVEELETTNEELQSTNEELETTNEELQSTNAELDATNRELAHRTEEMNKLAFYQRTILRSLSAAVVVLDTQGRINMWNLAAERLLGLAEGEALGQVLWTLAIPAIPRPVLGRVRKSLAQNLANRTEEVEYELPSGGTGTAMVAAVPILDGGAGLGSVLIFEDTTRQTALAAENARLKARNGSTQEKPS
ncbi:MAG: PAS domain-containing protein, partial [Myxococcales bacterium]